MKTIQKLQFLNNAISFFEENFLQLFSNYVIWFVCEKSQVQH
jgi:hypothetical protein